MSMENMTDEERLEQLKELRNVLARAIDRTTSGRDLSQLSKQYRETLEEIEALENAAINEDDSIGKILSMRKVSGKAGNVRY